MHARSVLEATFWESVRAADPAISMARVLPERPRGRTIVVGAGKGAAVMAAEFEKLWDGPLEGVVVTPYGYGSPCSRIDVVEASHPLPDRAGQMASRRLLNVVSNLGPDDLVVALMSGGGSALLPSPANGLSLEDEIAANMALLASGAPIDVMNTIRKHVSKIKGGRLAASATPAKVITIVMSDVPGDNPATVASGPTIADNSTRDDALRFIDAYRIGLPSHVLAHIRSPASTAPDPNDPVFGRNQVHLIASAKLSLDAAACKAQELGVTPVILSDSIEGEARHAGTVLASIAREVALRDRPFAKPVLLLCGGETTVTLRANGKGGRNTEFLLAFALGISGTAGIEALAADTDGIDGSETNAGAFANSKSVERMQGAGFDPVQLLNSNNSWIGFDAIGDLFTTGPTGVNVNDFRAFLIT